VFGRATIRLGIGPHSSIDTVFCLSGASLDKFWMHQDVIYDFVADLTGIGNRSIRESS